MFIHYRAHGIILKKKPLGEADQLFTIYTKEFGKLKILGRSIRKSSSKLRSGMEVFYLSEVEFIQGKIHKTLTDAILIEKFQNLRTDLKRLKIAFAISDVLDNFVREAEPDKKIWNLLNEILRKLNNFSFVISHLSLIYYYFFWNLISFLGYRPEVYNCSICQRKLKPEKLYFNEKEGGIICFNCFKKMKSGFPLKPEIVKILRIILKKDWKILSKLKIQKEYLKSLGEISKRYSSFLLEKNEQDT